MSQIESYLKLGLQHQDFEFFEPIASGSFGDVIKVSNKSLKSKLFAAKILTLRPSELQSNEPDVLHEISILEKISNLTTKPKSFPNYYGYSKETTAIRQTNYYIFFDYLPFSLRSFMKTQKDQNFKFLDFLLLKKTYNSLINGLSYLQSMNLTHRDLKPENLLLDESQNVTIVDFGTTKDNIQDMKTKKNDTKVDLTIAGTQSYMSPEMLAGLLNDDDYVTVNPYKSDVFSFGLIILELGTFSQIKYGNDLNKLKKKIDEALMFFEAYYMGILMDEEEKIEFLGILENVKGCLEMDPKKRPDFVELDVSQKERLRYHIFIQETSLENLHYIFDILRNQGSQIKKSEELLENSKINIEKNNNNSQENEEKSLKSRLSFDSTINTEKKMRFLNALKDEKFIDFIRGGFTSFQQLEEYFLINEIKGLDFHETITLESLETFLTNPIKSIKSFFNNEQQEGNGLLGKLSLIIRESLEISHLDLSKNPITFGSKKCMISEICEAIKKTKALISLNISRNYLGGSNENLVVLSEALKVNKTLKELDLGNNILGTKSENMRNLSEALILNNSLESLDLSKNKLNSKTDNLKNLAKCLKSNYSIQKLNLAGNCLYKSFDGMREINESLKMNKTLLILDLRKNKFGLNLKLFIDFCEALKANITLKELDLSENQLGKNNKNLKELSEAIKVNTSLNSLDLSENFFCYDAENMRFLSEALKKNLTISRISLENNNLGYSPTNIKYLGEFLRENQGLLMINLKKNKLMEAENFDFLGKSFLLNKTLKLLDLRFNNLKALPIWFDLSKEIIENNTNLKMSF